VLRLPLGDNAELRALEPWLAAEFAAFIEAARPHLAPWLPWATSITDEAGAREFLQRYADRQAGGEGRIYGIWLDDRLVGGALFRTFDAASGVCELGVWLAPSAQGQGLVTRAARQMIDWAIRVRGLNRVEWHCAVDNQRSIAVAQRLGMTREGVLRSAFSLDGARQDVEIWSLLAGDRR